MKKTKKLSLSRETLANLGTDILKRAAGGQTETCETVFGPRCEDVQSAGC